MTTGLVLGKFAPFHLGHQYLMKTALMEMDRLIVVVYNAAHTTEVPTAVRAGWIRETVPEAEVIVAEDGPQETGYTPEIIKTQNTYLLHILSGRKIDAFYSSEPYGQSVSEALGCRDRRVDPERITMPVSGTALRSNPALLKQWTPAAVYNSLKPRLYFIGAPSTGKTTISRMASQALNAACCPEYGRDYWFEHQVDHRLPMSGLEAIACGHNAAEDLAAQGPQDCVCVDTNLLTTQAYARYWFGIESPALQQTVQSRLWRYRHIFLCEADFPFEDTADRSGPASREQLQELNLALLHETGLQYTLLRGPPETRLETIQNYMRELYACSC